MNKKITLSSVTLLLLMLFMSSCEKNEVTSVKLNNASVKLLVGHQDSLTSTIQATGDVDEIVQTWTSSNNSVATVADGLITAVNTGTAIITVKAGKQSATCEVNVEDNLSLIYKDGALLYFGDYYNEKASSNYLLFLANETDTLVLEINALISVTDSIPAGIYNMVTQTSDYSKFTANTLLPACEDANIYGSWYFGTMNGPIFYGNIAVRSVNKFYVINANLFDCFGNNIKADFKGELYYVDGTKKENETIYAIKNINNQFVKHTNRKIHTYIFK